MNEQDLAMEMLNALRFYAEGGEDEGEAAICVLKKFGEGVNAMQEAAE